MAWPKPKQYIGGAQIVKTITTGADWRLYQLASGGRALVVTRELAERWEQDSLLSDDQMFYWFKGRASFRFITGCDHCDLAPVQGMFGLSYAHRDHVRAFAISMRETRKRLPGVSLHDAIFSQRHSRLLPTYTATERRPDDVIFGNWITSDAGPSIFAFEQILEDAFWLKQEDLLEAIDLARLQHGGSSSPSARAVTHFRLPGRHDLEAFLNEQVVSMVRTPEQYERFGITFPGAIILHGPPGCGKTYAVEELARFLDWPVFRLDASTIGSPYIHQTSVKIAGMFAKAEEAAPAMMIIDEMESYLTDRQHELSRGLHHVEEVTEFLRRIPKATEQKVLVVGMTNRLEMLDSAVTRRGRFDHIFHVTMPTAIEVEELLTHHTRELPLAPDVDVGELAAVLAGRPPSDIAFLVRQAALLAAQQDLQRVDRRMLELAVQRLSTMDSHSAPQGYPTPHTAENQPRVN